MVFWTIVVFVLGLLGLLHEIWLVQYDIPFFAEGTAVAIMLVSLGMLYALLKRSHKKE